MELYKALETIKNECVKHTECVVLWDWVIAVVALIQMDFRQIGIYKSLLISYLQ